MRYDNRLRKLKAKADSREAEMHLHWLKKKLEEGGSLAAKIVTLLQATDHNYLRTMSDEELNRRICELLLAMAEA